jgi:predicted component of type VI protein secretion system
MILLKVLSHNGVPTEGPSAPFDEMGGTIGRADSNQLVLPDPERMISRVHARIVYRNGAYAVVDNGSNPVVVNGGPVGSGRECVLKPGDLLEIGGYLVAVSTASAAPPADPFADLFADATGLAAPGPMPPAVRALSPLRTPSPPAPPPKPPALSPGHIPEDWDPFAPDSGHTPLAPSPSGGDVFANLAGAAGDSLDDLFGLGAASPAADPLAALASQPRRAQPTQLASDDALGSLFRTATIMPASVSDHASELNTPMPLPPRAAPQPATPPSGAVFSWNDPPRDGRVVTLPGVRGNALGDSTPLAPLSAPVQAMQTPLRPAPSQRPAPVAAAPGGGASEAELLAALLEGLAAPGLRLSELTPSTMQLLGVLLRESMGGAVALLVARAGLKREMRAELTMIVSRENNPLKFSPSAEVALQHLLGPSTPGFMAPGEAVRDAFNDLRAHQLGVMAGMRAALEGVLQRFDPQQLEAKLADRSGISSLIPGVRKARLWESFQELFAQLQSEAQDDFDELFGKAFLRAYEDQLDRLNDPPGRL